MDLWITCSCGDRSPHVPLLSMIQILVSGKMRIASHENMRHIEFWFWRLNFKLTVEEPVYFLWPAATLLYGFSIPNDSAIAILLEKMSRSKIDVREIPENL